MPQFEPLARANTEIVTNPHPHLAAIGGVQRELEREWAAFHPTPEQVLYHYTSVEGLLGILQSGRIWLSNAAYLNDLKEVEHGRDLVNQFLEEAVAQNSGNKAIESLVRTTRNVYDPFDGQWMGAFVACFCEDGDLLSQWRGYSDVGGGYALGIRFSDYTRTKLGLLSEEEEPGWKIPVLRRVVYDQEDQTELVRKTVQTFVRAVLEGSTAAPGQERDLGTQAASLLATLLIEFLCCFKHAGFREEREWRVIQLQSPRRSRINFRASNGLPVPYIVAQLDEPHDGEERGFPLHEVIVGPRLHRQRARGAVEFLLENAGAADYMDKVRLSEVPLV